MSKTTQDGADVVERLTEWVRAHGGRESSGFIRPIGVDDVADALGELSRLRTENERLREALRDLVSDREEVAKYSWKTWMNGEWHWNDEIWERNDPDEFELIKAARAALQETSNG